MQKLPPRFFVPSEKSLVSASKASGSVRRLYLVIQWLLAATTSLVPLAGTCQSVEHTSTRQWQFHLSEVERARQWVAYYTMLAANHQNTYDYLGVAKLWESYSSNQQSWADYYDRTMHPSGMANAGRIASLDPGLSWISASPMREGVRTPEIGDQAARPPLVLVKGLVFGLNSLPMAVHKMIEAGNYLQTKPYFWGGGHRILEHAGYDCSSAVSYLLIKAGLLDRVLNTSRLAGYGQRGEGRYVTVWVKAGGHTFITICGLRLDTAGGSLAQGPRWRTTSRSYAGFIPRHPPGF